MPTAPASARGKHPALTLILRVLRAAQLALLLCFVAYFVSVQINAIAYLAGKNHPIVGGATPPVPFDNAAAAAADIIAGLILEAIAAVIVCIIVSLSISTIRKR
jgi:hypothetical protein